MRLTKKLKAEYEQRGIAIIPNVYSDTEMATLKSAAYQLNPEEITKAGYKHNPVEYSNNKKALIFFPSIADNTINQIRIDERLQKIATFFLGDNIKQVNNQIYFREAGDHDQFAWHQDIVFRKPRDRFPGVEEGYLQTIIAVDDLTLTNGAIEFIEGSHKEGEQEITSSSKVTEMLRTFERRGLEGVKYIAPKGSVLLWNVLTVHGSEENTSNSDRMTYMNGFCRAENCLDYPWYIKNGKIVEDIDPICIP